MMRPKMGIPLFVIGAVLAAPAQGQPDIRKFIEIDGHEVGGMTVDMTGILYAADFGDIVWRITPEGERTRWAAGLYGSAGNAIDAKGNLLQASFYADEIVRIDRLGHVSQFAADGLSRPAGIAVDKKTGAVFVTNCGDDSVAHITAEGIVTQYAKHSLFRCPYGAALDRTGQLFVANYHDGNIVKVGSDGTVSLFAQVPSSGLAHLCFKGDQLYVAAFRSHAVYRVSAEGAAERVLGNGERGTVDGSGEDARLSFPYGLACHPWAPRLYVNEEPNPVAGSLSRRAIVRAITLKN